MIPVRGAVPSLQADETNVRGRATFEPLPHRPSPRSPQRSIIAMRKASLIPESKRSPPKSIMMTPAATPAPGRERNPPRSTTMMRAATQAQDRGRNPPRNFTKTGAANQMIDERRNILRSVTKKKTKVVVKVAATGDRDTNLRGRSTKS